MGIESCRNMIKRKATALVVLVAFVAGFGFSFVVRPEAVEAGEDDLYFAAEIAALEECADIGEEWGPPGSEQLEIFHPMPYEWDDDVYTVYYECTAANGIIYTGIEEFQCRGCVVPQ